MTVYWLATILRYASQLLVLPILSRILSPSDFGLVAIAMPFIAFAMTIGDGGLSASLLRKGDFEQRLWSSAFCLIQAGAISLTLLMLLMALLLSQFMDEPRLLVVMTSLCLAFLLQATSILPTAKLQHDRRFAALGLIELGAILTGIATVLIVALQGGGIWALVGQQISYWIIRAPLTWLATRLAIRPVFDLAVLREHLRFGWDVVRTNGINFASRYFDTVFIGIFLGPSAAGIYSVAFQIMRLPANLILGPAITALYPILVKLDAGQTQRAFMTLSAVLFALVIPPMWIVGVAHEPVFGLVLSSKWNEAGLTYFLMAPGGSLQTVTLLSTCFLTVLGRPDAQLRLTVEFAALWLVCIVIGAQFSVVAVAGAMNVAVAFYLLRFSQIALRVLGCTPRAYFQLALLPCLYAGAGALALCLLMGNVQSQLLLSCIALAFGVLGVALSMWHIRHLLIDLRVLLPSQKAA